MHHKFKLFSGIISYSFLFGFMSYANKKFNNQCDLFHIKKINYKFNQ